MRTTIAYAIVCLGLSGCSDNAPVEHRSADLIFVGQHIITMEDSNPAPTAVAIRDEKIVWLGDRSQIHRLSDAKTIVEDLGEHALLPGFIDAHGHFSGMVATIDLANVASPPVGPVTDILSLQEVVSSYIAENHVPKGKWVFGRGYDDSLLVEQRHPDKWDLDRISTQHPIALIHVSGHLNAVNSLALKRLDITAATLDPDGGYIRREDDSLEPNGVLEETAGLLLRNLIYGGNSLSASGLRRTLEAYASQGITTIQDGGVPAEQLANLQALAKRGTLYLDLVAYQWLTPEMSIPDPAQIGTYRNRFKRGGVKLMLDGSPQGKTAYLTKPYLVPPRGQTAGYRGYPSLGADDINRLVMRSFEREIPVLAHANGDAAADLLIDAVKATGASHDHRTTVIHAQTLREDQLDEMKKLEMIPSYFSAHAFYWGDWHRDSVLGEERAFRISPTKSTVDRGMIFTIHNDTPVVPPDMMRLIWATTNRKTRSGQVLGEAQRISTLDALKAVTIHAAYQYFEEDSKGSIKPGKQADLVILSRDPLQASQEELKDIEVVKTISRGKTVFQKAPG
jgi:predicted amidohydrolase YtcJ